MLTFGVGYSVLWRSESKRQLSTVDGAQVVRECRLCETRSSVEAVMIGNRQRVQSQSYALLDQFLGIAHPVQEAEVAVTVQLRVRHPWSGRPLDPQSIRLVGGPFV